MEFQYQPMSQEQSQLFLMAVVLERDRIDVMDSLAKPSAAQIVENIVSRIANFQLPIVFTPHALLAAVALCDRAAAAVVLLIDCLNKGLKVVDTRALAKVYPDGFYTEQTLIEYCKTKIMTRQIPWSEIF